VEIVHSVATKDYLILIAIVSKESEKAIAVLLPLQEMFICENQGNVRVVRVIYTAMQFEEGKRIEALLHFEVKTLIVLKKCNEFLMPFWRRAVSPLHQQVYISRGYSAPTKSGNKFMEIGRLELTEEGRNSGLDLKEVTFVDSIVGYSRETACFEASAKEGITEEITEAVSVRHLKFPWM
jgi:hypothetical protein